MFEARAPLAAGAPTYPRLLGDIGGTNARFGWQATASEAVSRVQVLPCAEYASPQTAIEAYLRAQQLPAPAWAALGIACPVSGDSVRMTNLAWQFSAEALRRALALSRLVLLNDFSALALALPGLPAAHKRAVGGGQAADQAPIGLIGPGTGLGVSGLVPGIQSGQWLPIPGQGGHVSLACSNAQEFAVLQVLQKRYGHVSAERVLSGPGLVDLYHALCELAQGPGREITSAAEVLQRAAEAPASQANQALDLFCAWLGSVAGDLALTLGARGGIYIGGGIVPRLGARLEASAFRARFEAKGRFASYLQDIPTWVIESPVSPALQGAAMALAL